jgi:hypothetical protein
MSEKRVLGAECWVLSHAHPNRAVGLSTQHPALSTMRIY